MGNRPIIIRNPNAVRPWQHVLEPLSGYLVLAEKLYTDGAAFAQGWMEVQDEGSQLLAVLLGARRGEMVVCVAPDGREIARGLANYSALEAQKIIGQSSDAIVGLLGYMAEPELVHRDNLILV